MISLRPTKSIWRVISENRWFKNIREAASLSLFFLTLISHTKAPHIRRVILCQSDFFLGHIRIVCSLAKRLSFLALGHFFAVRLVAGFNKEKLKVLRRKEPAIYAEPFRGIIRVRRLAAGWSIPHSRFLVALKRTAEKACQTRKGDFLRASVLCVRDWGKNRLDKVSRVLYAVPSLNIEYY